MCTITYPLCIVQLSRVLFLSLVNYLQKKRENWTPQEFLAIWYDYIIGLEEEGIYRKPGIISKATKLYKTAIERSKMNSINLTNEEDWDTKTIASAVKGYLSKQLEEPILTFALHSQFIECASKSCDSHVI